MLSVSDEVMKVMSFDDQIRASVRPEVLRIPRMRRLGYLQALLKAIGHGGCTKEDAREAIIQIVRELDADKAAALGRRAPKLPKADSLTEQCIQMTTRLGLVERHRNQLLRTPVGASLDSTDPHQTRSTLFRLLWDVFPHFRTIVSAVCLRPEGFLLPVNRYEGAFAYDASQQGLVIDQMSFEIVRDLATELLVLNWRPIFQDKGAHQRVYAVGTSKTTSPTYGLSAPCQPAADPPGTVLSVWSEFYAVPSREGGQWTFIGNVVDVDRFENALWKHYLLLTDRVPRFPVLYPILRDAVCESLRIADPRFDELIQRLLRNPDRLDIFPAQGILDYSAKTAVTYKQIPPRTNAGQFMTFLKIDRRGNRSGN